MQWYFDFISPFAYLQSSRLTEFEAAEPVECVPVLFAGLLDHWSNVGPAEVPPKRTWTFQHVIWLAHRDQIEFTLPEYHPFNPLPLLRLSIAMDNRIDVVHRLFRFVWVEGFTPQNTVAFSALLDELGVTPDAINAEPVKSQLRANGEQAIARGIFGVPTIARDEQTFWGYDATDMASAHRDARLDPDRWPAQELDAVDAFPEGPGRRR